VYTVSVKLSPINRNSTKVDEIQGTYGGMTIACDPEIGQHFQAWSLSQESESPGADKEQISLLSLEKYCASADRSNLV
jgi:hypothetical protein